MRRLITLLLALLVMVAAESCSCGDPIDGRSPQVFGDFKHQALASAVKFPLEADCSIGGNEACESGTCAKMGLGYGQGYRCAARCSGAQPCSLGYRCQALYPSSDVGVCVRLPLPAGVKP
jgi:hypothetical protein